MITSLIIMGIILLVAATATRFSMVTLKLAINEESRTAALQTTQAVIDAALIVGDNTAVRGGAGATNCTENFVETCTWYEVELPSGPFADYITAGDVQFRSRRGFPAFIPPPRGLETSLRAFDAAPFELEATFDKRDENQGQAQINEGLILLVPKY